MTDTRGRNLCHDLWKRSLEMAGHVDKRGLLEDSARQRFCNTFPGSCVERQRVTARGSRPGAVVVVVASAIAEISFCRSIDALLEMG